MDQKPDNTDIRMLKKAAINSTALMIAVIFISLLCTKYGDPESYANKKFFAKAWGEDISGEQQSGGISLVDGVEETEYALEDLGEKYIQIEKTSENMGILVKDLYINQEIEIVLTGLLETSMSKESIVRYSKGNLFRGTPFFEVEVPTEDSDMTEKIAVNQEELFESLTGQSDSFIADKKVNQDDFANNINVVHSKNSSSNTFTATIRINLDNVYVYTVYEDLRYYYIKMDKPRDIYDKIIVVDIGHGGSDTGTHPKKQSYSEKDINLKIGLYLKELLDEENIKVYYTRLSDEKIYLRPRVSLANNLDADFFVSIHCNASDLSEPNGTEVLYKKGLKKNGLSSKALSEIFLNEVHNVAGLRNRGVIKRDDIYIIKNAEVPVALVEVGYMTNQQDFDFLIEDKNQKEVAKGIYAGILKAFGKIDEYKEQ